MLTAGPSGARSNPRRTAHDAKTRHGSVCVKSRPSAECRASKRSSSVVRSRFQVRQRVGRSAPSSSAISSSIVSLPRHRGVRFQSTSAVRATRTRAPATGITLCAAIRYAFGDPLPRSTQSTPRATPASGDRVRAFYRRFPTGSIRRSWSVSTMTSSSSRPSVYRDPRPAPDDRLGLKGPHHLEPWTTIEADRAVRVGGRRQALANRDFAGRAGRRGRRWRRSGG